MELADWIDRIKGDGFPDNEGFEHITPKNARDRDAKTMPEQPGFGLRLREVH